MLCFFFSMFIVFFFQAEDGIRDAQESRGLGDVYKRARAAGFRPPDAPGSARSAAPRRGLDARSTNTDCPRLTEIKAAVGRGAPAGIIQDAMPEHVQPAILLGAYDRTAGR